MSYTVNFDNNFFKQFKIKWLNTKQILLLLSNLEQLMKMKFIELSLTFNDELPKNGEYYIFRKDLVNWKLDGHQWKKRQDGSLIESSTILKVQGSKVNIYKFIKANSMFILFCK